MNPERWKQVDGLLEAALGLPSGDREEFLREKCAGDPELEREVRSLLDSHHKLGGFLESPAMLVAAQALTETRGDRDPLLGRTISHYRVIKKIGSGGMGVVYEAEDLRLGRRVAIKVMLESDAANSKALLRFELEARTASALSHPNICTLYEVEEYDGKPVIVMELLEGQTVKQRISAGRIPWTQLVQWGIDVADALETAHASGMIHRDIKPANLFVTKRGRVKVLDFGLAKLAAPVPKTSLPEDTSLTTEGVTPGTTAYMSPEQVRGYELDGRTDVFSLGVVLYEVATGACPFLEGNTTRTLEAVLTKSPPPLTSCDPELPKELEEIVAKALEKDVSLRYQSAVDLHRDLELLKRKADGGQFIAGESFSQKSATAAESRPGNLPMQRTPLVGRVREMEAAKELLLRGDVRLVTVTGPGGIGKTRLAVQLASGLVEHFSAGIHFVALSLLNDPGLIAAVIVQTLAFRQVGGQSPLEVLKENLRNTPAPMLLLLDNFEHLIQAAPIVAELLAVAPSLKILVTSRAALHVYGEHEFPVPPLALPDSRSVLRVETLSRCSAIELFTERAVAAKPDFVLSPENARAVAEICIRLDGLPLAIELAAARIKVLSPASMLTRLASRLQLLTGGARDLPQRQQTLRAAMDWSYDLLSSEEQRLFRRLSVFAGGCNLEGVEAVCDTKGDLNLDLLEGMSSMVDKSLVQQIEPGKGESRFGMLETIREYALEKLEASGESADTRRAHAAYCLILAEETAEQGGVEGPDWLEGFMLEQDNFRAALDWLTETRNAEWGLRLGAALFRFWETSENFAEGRNRLHKVLRLAEAADPTKSRCRALFAAGVLAVGQGDYAPADVMIMESLEIARQLDDRHAAAVALNALGVNARDRGEIPIARSLFEESLVIWRELDDPRAIARCLSNLANVVMLQNDYARSQSLYGECLSIFEELGDRTGVAWTTNYQGDVARHHGDLTAARALYEKGLGIFRELGDRWGIAATLADLGSLAREQRDYSSARSLYRESIKIFQDLDHKRGIARLLEAFACVAAVQHESARSLRLAGAAAALRQNIGAPLTSAEQTKLESGLHVARQALTTDGGTAWSEGWALPIEKAIEEAMMIEIASSSS
jgi:predicted ATPase